MYAGDLQWWQKAYVPRAGKEWPVFRGERWTISGSAKSRYGCQLIAGVHRSHGGLSDKPGTIVVGGNSGYAAVSLAVEFGASRVVLLGYDMGATKGTHWHGNHPSGLGNGNNFRAWLRRFGVLAKDAKDRGIEVVNATRQTALTCFPRASIEDALNGEVANER